MVRPDEHDHNLTPEQRLIPSNIRVAAYKRIPRTCDTVRAILDDAMRSSMADVGIAEHDAPIVDAAISRASLRIRDEVTQPFRTEQMRLLQASGLALIKDPETGITENPLEYDLYSILEVEYGMPRTDVKNRLFVLLYSLPYGSNKKTGKTLIDMCREALEFQGCRKVEKSA